MISVITADIINSRKVEPSIWLSLLNEELTKFGSNPKDWEIYRGDSFQLILNEPKKALISAIKIKSVIKQVKDIDIRMSIGLGEKAFDALRATESNGTAFINSGDKFDRLKQEKQNLAVKSNSEDFDREINLYLKLGLIAMDNWTPNAAEIVHLALEHPNASQGFLGNLIGIKQNAVSTRLKRAYFEEIKELDEMYKTKLEVMLW